MELSCGNQVLKRLGNPETLEPGAKLPSLVSLEIVDQRQCLVVGLPFFEQTALAHHEGLVIGLALRVRRT